MKVKNYLAMAVMLCGILPFTACTEEESVRRSEVSVSLNMNGLSAESRLTINSGICRFENLTTREVVELPYQASGMMQFLPEGLYRVNFQGKGVLLPSDKSEAIEVRVQGKEENVEVKEGKVSLELKLYAVSSGGNRSDFLLSEIAISGTLYPSSDGSKPRQYNGDAYFVITNNSDKPLYADGLILAESSFLSTRQQDYTPDVMGEAMTVSTILRIPGDGHTYLVNPGEQLILCDNAMNHKEKNPLSVDLSGADFEWFIESAGQNKKDVDNPLVKNLDVVVANTRTLWIPSKQGNRAYALARIPSDKTDSYLREYAYEPIYQLLNPKNKQLIPMTVKGAYKLPNEWIIDAVQLAPQKNHVWNVIAPSLDMGFTSLGELAEVNNHAGKGVTRKVLFITEEGRKVYQDTDNSTEDFIPSVPFSLLN